MLFLECKSHEVCRRIQQEKYPFTRKDVYIKQNRPKTQNEEVHAKNMNMHAFVRSVARSCITASNYTGTNSQQLKV